MPVSETHERSVSSVRLAAALLTHRQYDALLQAIPWARMGRVPYGARTLGVFGRMGRARDVRAWGAQRCARGAWGAQRCGNAPVAPKTCTQASKSGRKTAIRDARVHVLRSRGCTDVGSRHISPKCGRSGAPHAPHARERAQRCSPKAATTPRPSKAVNAGGPASPCSVIRSAQREDIGTRGSGASAGNERPMRP